jgi:methionine-rich copper-binding protein CopC
MTWKRSGLWKLLAAAGLHALLGVAGAKAHALLESASPAVGGSVSGSPGSIQLQFSQGVEARFSGISVTGPNGERVTTSGATNAGAKNTLRTSLGQKLKPGRYHVHWHAVSVDTHRTEGSYTFEVRP